jgi:predicted DCC family thiol-disulfide oxidoreductase YuxK
MHDGQAREDSLHLLLYDGECGFCHRTVRFVLAHDRRRVFRFAALQSAVTAAELARLGGGPVDSSTVHVIERFRSDRPVLQRRAGAALAVARALGWPWNLLTVFGILPRPWLDAAYAVVARHRHGLGSPDACFLPRPQDRDRFLDAGANPAPRSGVQ